jgi:hypothetical protein
MGSLRLPTGMYELMPSKSPEGWRLAVAKQDEYKCGWDRGYLDGKA